jgi:kynurenine formamidase
VNHRQPPSPAPFIDLTVPVRSTPPRATAWGIPDAAAQPFAAGDFVAAVAQGGSVNCDVWTFSVHSSGTHTETARHIVDSGAPPISDIHFPPLLDALVLRVAPEAFRDTEESYDGAPCDNDLVITREGLQRAIAERNSPPVSALVVLSGTIRTPEDARFEYEPAPYFTNEAMTWIVETLAPTHLLVDLPSVDRLWDGGKVANHRRFWGVTSAGVARPLNTITEFLCAEPDLASGEYQLQMSVSSLVADAAPSRILLYPSK